MDKMDDIKGALTRKKTHWCQEQRATGEDEIVIKWHVRAWFIEVVETEECYGPIRYCPFCKDTLPTCKSSGSK